MENEKIMEMYVDSLITLCHILDNYEEFNNNLIKLNPCKYSPSELHKLYRISKGERVFGAKKLKKFYQENKAVIDTINEHERISSFITSNYSGWNQQITKEKEHLRFFYQYLLKNKEQLEQIISVLEKIESLDFSTIKMVEGYDFTEESQSISACGYNSEIVYYDNIQIEPSYSNAIKYRTTGSNYKMVFEFFLGSIKRCSNESIILNSLTFAPSRLPDELSPEAMFDYIINLSQKLDDSYSAINSSINFSINIADMQENFESLDKVINELNDAQTRAEARESLVKIQTELAKLQALSSEYNSSIIEENPELTLQKLDEERKLYLARRDITDFD